MMMYGLGDKTIRRIQDVFAKHPLVERVILYGSRAKGTYKSGSDIDLTLHGEGIGNDEKNKILDELDDLDLPYTIDLSVFDQLTHDNLREHIERVGLVFYQREAGSSSEFRG